MIDDDGRPVRRGTHPSTWKWALVVDGVEVAHGETPEHCEQFRTVFGGEVMRRTSRREAPKKQKRLARE